MHSDRNSSKADTFHGPTTYEPNFKTNSERLKSFAKHEYGWVGVSELGLDN